MESDAGTSRLARGNAAGTGLAVTVRTSTVEKALAAPAPTPFDVVWADPPYDLPGERLAGVLAAVVAGGWLAADGLLIVERSGRDPEPVWPDAVPDRWFRRYGETTLHFATKGR